MNARTCKSCHKTIWWTVTTNGTKMPIDAHTYPDGNVTIKSDGRGGYIATVHGPLFLDALDRQEPEPNRFKSHFATCPDAAKFRRKIVQGRTSAAVRAGEDD